MVGSCDCLPDCQHRLSKHWRRLLSCETCRGTNTSQNSDEAISSKSEWQGSKPKQRCEKQNYPVVDYVFGYGSIIDCASRTSSMGVNGCRAAIFCTLSSSFGMVRRWNFRSSTGFTALGVRNARGSGSPISGVCFAAGSSMDSFDLREKGYKRVEVPLSMITVVECSRNSDCDCAGDNLANCHAPEINQFASCLRDGSSDGSAAKPRVWMYVPEHVQDVDPSYPVCQTYLDVVLNGCLTWGGEMAALDFCDTTEGWSDFFLNDVPLSRRPWLHRPKNTWRTIDNILEQRASVTHFHQRCHPEEFASAMKKWKKRASVQNNSKAIAASVGFSSAQETQKAVNSAWEMLTARLGRSHPPSFIVLGLTSNHKVAEAQRMLRRLAPRTAFIGGTTCQGLLVDGHWLAQQSTALALWGVHDPDGWYEVVHADFELATTDEHVARIVEQAANEGAHRAQFELSRRPQLSSPARTHAGNALQAECSSSSPSFVYMICAPGQEEEALVGLRDAVGCEVAIVGGSSAHRDPAEAGWSQLSSLPPDVTHNGVSFALCWPSVVVISAFGAGFTTAGPHGKVTKVALGDKRCLLEIDGSPAAEVYDTWTQGKVLAEGWLDSGVEHAILAESVPLPLGQEVAPHSLTGLPQYRILHPSIICPTTKSIKCFADISPGSDIFLMRSDRSSLKGRFSKVARHLLEESDLHSDQLVGVLGIFCAGCMMHLSDEMQDVAEDFAAAVGWAPTLGLCTFGEQGCIAEQSANGNLMVSTLMFTKLKLLGQGLRPELLQGSLSQTESLPPDSSPPSVRMLHFGPTQEFH